MAKLNPFPVVVLYSFDIAAAEVDQVNLAAYLMGFNDTIAQFIINMNAFISDLNIYLHLLLMKRSIVLMFCCYIPAIGGTAFFCCANCCCICGIKAVVVVFVLPGIVDGGNVPIGGIFGIIAFGGALDVTEPNDDAGRPRLMPVTLAAAAIAAGDGTDDGPNGLGNGVAASDRGVPPGPPAPGPFFLLLPAFGLSISTSSFGMSATFVKNTFSSACAITTTSSPGLLYT